MKINSKVKVITPPLDNIETKGYVDKGASATVVDGRQEFPDLYTEFLKKFKNDQDVLFSGDFIWIKWNRNDPKWHGRIDGLYLRHRFVKIKRLINSSRVLN